MVVGGFGGGVLSDVWLLDVIDGSWTEVLHAHAHGVHMYRCASDLNSASSATSVVDGIKYYINLSSRPSPVYILIVRWWTTL